MPVRNGAAYIAEAARSIRRQTFLDWELVLIDDNSNDMSADIVSRIIPSNRLEILSHDRNIGVAASLNSGFAAAKGGYIARLDADDVADPERLQRQYELLRQSPQLNATFGWFRFIDRHSRILPTVALTHPVSERGIDPTLLLGNPLCHPSVCFNATRGVSIRYPNHHYEDYSLWLSSTTSWRVHVDPRPMTYWRLHPGNQSRTRASEGKDELLPVFCAAAARQGLHVHPTVARAMLFPADSLSHHLAREVVATQRVIQQHIESSGEQGASDIARRMQASWMLRALAHGNRIDSLKLLSHLNARERRSLRSAALIAGRGRMPSAGRRRLRIDQWESAST
jgi:hypothetical protein